MLLDTKELWLQGKFYIQFDPVFIISVVIERLLETQLNVLMKQETS